MDGAALGSLIIIPFIIALIVCILISVPIFQSDADGFTKFIGFALLGIGGGVVVFFISFFILTIIWNATTNINDSNAYKQQTFTTRMANDSLLKLGVKGTFESDCKIRLCPKCGAVEISGEKLSPCYKCGYNPIIILENEKISEARQSVIRQINQCHNINS